VYVPEHHPLLLTRALKEDAACMSIQGAILGLAERRVTWLLFLAMQGDEEVARNVRAKGPEVNVGPCRILGLCRRALFYTPEHHPLIVRRAGEEEAYLGKCSATLPQHSPQPI